jgi:hypothetical protein
MQRLATDVEKYWEGGKACCLTLIAQFKRQTTTVDIHTRQ